MSPLSTPRSTRSVSPANDANAGSPAILTPGRKIKAMLAAFDSDSDSDNGKSTTRASLPKLNLEANRSGDALQRDHALSDNDEDEDDDEEDIIMPKGRMAARMQVQEQESNESASKDRDETAYERVAKSLQEKADSRPHSPENEDISSDDDLPTAGLRRGLRKVAQDAEIDEAERSPSPARSFSPLFVSSPAKGQEESENEDITNDTDKNQKSQPNSRFLALVAQKRKEREEKERIEEEKKAARLEKMKQFSSDILSGEDSDDDGTGRRLTQQARPARKASKKALEEMNRETQRISRNMQLAHQARTKKKITKESFFARFNFMQPQGQDKSTPAQDNSSTTAGSQDSSDGEVQRENATPLTSPVRASSPNKTAGVATDSHRDASAPMEEPESANDGEKLPSLSELLTKSLPPKEPTIVARADVRMEESRPEPTKAGAKPLRKTLTKPPVRVRISRQFVAEHQKNDSDDELEVITSPAKTRRIAAFENLPSKQAQESSSMLKLKALAHLTSPTRRTTSMSPAELSAGLRIQARQQAAKERAERIEELRAKGIHIETAEERAAMDAEVEDLVEKARKEAEEIRKQEREESKKKDKSEMVGLDSEEDEDYEEEEENEDGDAEDEDDDEEEQEDTDNEALVENEAGEAEESEGERTEASDLGDEIEAAVSTRRKRPIRVISDDEDEEQDPKTPARSVTHHPESVKKPHFPDMPTSDNFTMALSQAFAATLGGSQFESQREELSVIFGSVPDPVGPSAKFQEADSQVLVKDSQERRESVDILHGFVQSEARVSESPGPKIFSQYSQIPDPTQDAGFVMSPFDQSKRFVDPPVSTVETVLLPRDESPVARKGKVLRRGHRAETVDADDNGFEIKASAFDIMRKAAKKVPIPFDKNNSKAKEVVDEAAEESEDEYAGLGGASDDDAGEENEYDQEMINDNSGEVVDEKELAALNANHQRAMDEKQVSKLLRDITTGALRRRRAADDEFDLDDSDDELIARRRAKQREFAKMRKALLADEKIGEIAENPKKAAFFRAIEDRDQDDDMDLDFLDEHTDSQDNASSQDVQAEVADEQSAIAGSKRKRPLEPSATDIANRPPPHLRRTPASAVSRKPSTLAEIRETVSFLTETPEYDSFHEDASTEDDDDEDHETSGGANDSPADEENARTKDGFAIPTNPRRTRGPVVDRLSLLRQASSNSASSANNKLAFQSTSSVDPIAKIGFRPPPFLRRSTTGSSSTSTSSVSSGSSSVRTKTGSAPAAAHGKKGAVNYYTAAREREREKELRMKQRGSSSNINALLSKHAGGSLGSIVGKGQWE